MAKDIFTAEWFPYYFERFEGSDRVAVMSLAEEGAYHRAIRLAWKYGSVPADPEMLAAKIQKRCTAKVAETVLKCFEAMPDQPSRMTHPVIEEIRAEQEKKYLNRVKGGKAAAEARNINAANKDTSSITEYCSSNSPAHKESKREIETKREEKEKRGEETTALQIHLGTILAGVMAELGLQKLSLSAQRSWVNEATLAFENHFLARDFVECLSLLRKQRGYAIKPEWVTENLPELGKLRIKVAPATNGKPKGLTGRQLAAEVERKEREAQV